MMIRLFNAWGPKRMAGGCKKWRHLPLCVAWLVLSALRGELAVAQPLMQPNGAVVKMPNNRSQSRLSGLSFTLDSRWVNNYGYRPIEVTVGAPKPATSDRLIKVRLTAKPFDWRLGGVSVEKELTLPAGGAKATMSLLLPQLTRQQWASGQFVTWEVLVDGVRDRDLSYDPTSGAMPFAATSVSDVGFSMLAIGTGVPSRQTVFSSSLEFEALSLSVRELPPRWIDYTCFDVITLAPNVLADLKATNPDARTAIERWTRAGGQLWIVDAGSAWERVSSLEELLRFPQSRGLPGGEAPAALSLEQVQRRGWNTVEALAQNWNGRVVTFAEYGSGRQHVVRDPRVMQRLQSSGRYYVVSEGQELVDPARATDYAQWFVEQPLGLGDVRAFRGSGILASVQSAYSGQPAPAVTGTTAGSPRRTSEEKARIEANHGAEIAAAIESALDWSTRHGVTPDEPQPEFSDWLVPGVGLAPVTEFRILITLFVLLIGPVNYVLLKKYQRLHLLVITVPLAALLLTGTLFGYALIADGLGTRVRVQSLTMLDQQVGEAACWARLSYYSGLAPAGGLSMTGDTAVYPIVAPSYGSGANPDLQINREIIWGANTTRLTRGWLRSRTPTQYLTVRSRATPATLQVRPSGENLRVRNDLGVEVRYAVVVDDKGRMFSGESVAPGAVSELTLTDGTTATTRFQSLRREAQPAIPPPAMVAGRPRNGVFSNSAYFAGQQWYPSPRFSDGLMDEEMERWTTFTNSVPASSGAAWRNRTYVAVTNTGAEVQLGLERAREEASFHVLVGRW